MNKLRHHCRYCRSKLAAPEEIERQAFCTRGCHSSYYRHRCVVCEKAIERSAPNKRLCGRRQCRADFRAFPHLYVYRLDDPSSAPKPASETPGFIGSKTPIWHHVAGPELSARSFALATLPLEPNFAARIARQNRAGGSVRNVPDNLVGGYRFPDAEPLEPTLAAFLARIESRLLGEPLPTIESPSIVPADPLHIPAFLERTR